MKKRKKIIIGITSGVVFSLVAVLTGLVITGWKVGWGPFTFMQLNEHKNNILKRYDPKENQNKIVFYGASNFRLWTEMENDLAEYKVQNHGFGGSTDHNLLESADSLLYPYNPSVVFFQTGSNDYVSLKGNDEEKISSCMDFKKEMFSTFHQKLPNAKFLVMSGILLPKRSQYTELTKKINESLANYSETQEYMTFVDAEKMTFDGTNYRDGLFISDGIHLNHTGQLEWCNNYIKPAIERLVSKYPSLSSIRK